ncbi:hypothetical protein [Jannaschia pohangensis]|uniref:Uncharacterized protein n=1 Tax=Jannaschia pohangensis TaxID=390807 RepID=A0A1I3IJR2_9RHOB|nr:hypothetical protein [Jannaschia pohangensis]SFI48120.1 hypothetical protein SAMN04488095_0998 [Jannaschia pohangensis]
MALGLTLHRIGQDVLTPLRLLRALMTGFGRPVPVATRQIAGQVVPPGLDLFQRMLLDLSSQTHLRRTPPHPVTSLRATLKTVGTTLVIDPTSIVDRLPIERAHLDSLLADLTPDRVLATVRTFATPLGVLLTVTRRPAPDEILPDLPRMGRIAALYGGHVAQRRDLNDLEEIAIFLPVTRC